MGILGCIIRETVPEALESFLGWIQSPVEELVFDGRDMPTFVWKGEGEAL